MFKNNTAISPGVVFGPLKGFGIAREYIRNAPGPDVRNMRAGMVGSLAFTSLVSSLMGPGTSSAYGATLFNAVEHMKAVNNNSTPGLVFLYPESRIRFQKLARLKKLAIANDLRIIKFSNTEVIVLKIMIGGVILFWLIILSSYLLPRLYKTHRKFCKNKRISRYIINYKYAPCGSVSSKLSPLFRSCDLAQTETSSKIQRMARTLGFLVIRNRVFLKASSC